MILGVEVSDISQAQAIKKVQEFLNDSKQHYIVTPNPEIVLAASKSAKLRSVFDKADLSLPDGFGLKIAARILGQKLHHRVAGADFMLQIAALGAQERQSVFLLGGQAGVAKKAALKLQKMHPSLKIAGAESGGKVIKENNAWATSDRELIKKINQSQARILFVAFGCPKQEKWLFHNLAKLDSVKLAMTVGGSLDFLAHTARRAPAIMRQIGLEWLWRLIQNPRRVRRIWNATIGFIWKILMARLRIAFTYRPNVVGFIPRHPERSEAESRDLVDKQWDPSTPRPGRVGRDDAVEVLLVQRANEKYEHWQLPQGGVDQGESEVEAVLREMGEEIGASQLKILGRHPQKYSYDWSRWHQRRGSYRGQRQTIFYLRFDQSRDSIKIDEHEIRAYEWTLIDKVITKVHPLRRTMIGMAVNYWKTVIGKQKSVQKSENGK